MPPRPRSSRACRRAAGSDPSLISSRASSRGSTAVLRASAFLTPTATPSSRSPSSSRWSPSPSPRSRLRAASRCRPSSRASRSSRRCTPTTPSACRWRPRGCTRRRTSTRSRDASPPSPPSPSSSASTAPCPTPRWRACSPTVSTGSRPSAVPRPSRPGTTATDLRGSSPSSTAPRRSAGTIPSRTWCCPCSSSPRSSSRKR
mmetsp:Transcript_7836/g.31028  ORF Transcript_7836/g.31028 Transcript_7836/m.31028 type:complete len:202 (+) Transcript_7836:391-996(+)